TGGSIMTAKRNLLTGTFLVTAFVGSGTLLSPLAGQGWPAGLANYRDAAEVDARLTELAAGSTHAQLYTIGASLDYHTNPRRRTLSSIRAIRISASTDERVGDDIGKNSILFEAGTHPREWLSTESAL